MIGTKFSTNYQKLQKKTHFFTDNFLKRKKQKKKKEPKCNQKISNSNSRKQQTQSLQHKFEFT